MTLTPTPTNGNGASGDSGGRNRTGILAVQAGDHIGISADQARHGSVQVIEQD